MKLHSKSRVGIVVSGLTIVAGIAAAAGGAFEAELGTDAAKVAEDVKIHMVNGDNDGLESGKGLVPYLKALGGPPKRVALASFYVWDCGNKKESSYRMYGGDYVYRVSTTRRRSVDDGEIDKLATELYDASIGALKESFAADGMQLLTPDEFLDTPEKKEAYAKTPIEEGGTAKLMGFLQKKSAEEWQWGAPEGFRIVKISTVGDDRGNNFRLGTTGVAVGKLANSAGHDLAKALGVDAVVFLYNVVQAQKDSIRLRGTYAYMFGPNPVADSGQGSYWPGQQYSGVYLRTNVEFIKTDKEGRALDEDYRGFAIVGRAVGTRMAQHVKGKTG